MPAFTTNQWAIVALVLVLGWLLGLASRSGGAKWRTEYERERASHAEYRKDQEARIAAADARIAEFERHEPAIGTASPRGIAPVATANRDDLTTIRGIDRTRENAINDAGVHTYRDVEQLGSTEAAALEGRLALSAGTIERDRWREQAALLRGGNVDEWRRQYG